MNNTFSFSRFARLLRLTLFQEKQRALLTLLISLGIALSFCLLSYVVSTLLTHQKVFNGHEYFFLVSLFIGGYLFSGAAFVPFRQRPSTYRYLMLAASPLEKYLAQWLIHFLLFPVVYLLAYGLFSVLFNFLAPIAYPAFYLSFGLSPGVWVSLLAFTFIQPIWLFGAAFFIKVPLIKTLLFGGLLVILIIFGLVFFYEPDTYTAFFPRALYVFGYLIPLVGLLFGWLTYWTLQEKEV